MHVPSVGQKVPRWGNKLTRAIGRMLLAGYRWHIEGEVLNASKFVIVFAPHTTSWDFLTTVGTRLALGLESYWLVSDAFTWWPLGNFMRWLGGIPVDRSRRHDLVSLMVKRFEENDEFILTIAPEGTRRRMREWKAGFWHIAVRARVPIQIATIDYQKRATVFGPVLEPSDSLEADMKYIQAHYRDVQAKYPHQFDGEYIYMLPNNSTKKHAR